MKDDLEPASEWVTTANEWTTFIVGMQAVVRWLFTCFDACPALAFCVDRVVQG